jgi:hypothetical protein
LHIFCSLAQTHEIVSKSAHARQNHRKTPSFLPNLVLSCLRVILQRHTHYTKPCHTNANSRYAHKIVQNRLHRSVHHYSRMQSFSKEKNASIMIIYEAFQVAESMSWVDKTSHTCQLPMRLHNISFPDQNTLHVCILLSREWQFVHTCIHPCPLFPQLHPNKRSAANSKAHSMVRQLFHLGMLYECCKNNSRCQYTLLSLIQSKLL